MNRLQRQVAKWLGFSYLIDAANWQHRFQRPYEPITANGISEEVSLSDWQTLVSDSRKLFCNLGPVKGALVDKAVYSIGRAWDAKSLAADRVWAKKAEYWVNKIWYPTSDVRGGMYDFKTDLCLASITIDRDGEVYPLLTETPNGWPQVQWIPAHMIGMDEGEEMVSEGPYTGLMIKQGVICNDRGAAVAFRVLKPDGGHTDYTARDMMQLYDPDWFDQVRGFPAFTHALLDLKDVRTVQGNEKMASAIMSSIGLIEENELGAPDPNDPGNFLRKVQTAPNGPITSGPTAIVQQFQGITARFFRAGTGSKLTSLKNDRPGTAQDDFMNRLIRNGCTGAGWPYELTWDSSKLGGANVRLLVARAERTVEDRQDLLKPPARRMVGYAVAKAIKNGWLEANDEWYKWDFGMPARMSVDYGRDGNSDREDYKLGITNLSDILQQEGKNLEDHIAERKAENEQLRLAGLPIYGPDGKPIGADQSNPSADTAVAA